MKNLVGILVTILCLKVSGQSISIPVPESKIVDYQGVYHFGDSEDESDLVLIKSSTGWLGQFHMGEWNQGADEWIKIYQNLENVTIEGNKFHSEKYTGVFVVKNFEGEKKVGLTLTPNLKYDVVEASKIGFFSIILDGFFAGKFPQASFMELNEADLNEMNSEELRLMRNEIFARYGHRFKVGGDMEAHFNQQSWYTPQHDSILEFLTSLERKNIAEIRRLEESR